MYAVGCCQPIQLSMAHTTRLCIVWRILHALQQGTYMSWRYTSSYTYLQCLFWRACFTIILHGIVLHTCYARVSQVWQDYHYYTGIHQVSQHQAMVVYQLPTHTITQAIIHCVTHQRHIVALLGFFITAAYWFYSLMVRTCPCHGHGRGSTPRRIVQQLFFVDLLTFYCQTF